MGSILLQAGDAGHRYSLPHSRIMIHQPLGGARGACSDIQIQANEIKNLQSQLYKIYEKHTHQNLEKITLACDRDNYMSPEEAKEFGLIDEIIQPKGKKVKE